MAKSKVVWLLVAVNVLLAAVLVWRFGERQAWAQRGGRPSDYLMMPGRVMGGANGVVYIVDTSNGLLSAAVYDDSRGRIEQMQPIDLNQVFAAGGGVGPKRGN